MRSSFFKTRGPKKFEYTPRYYNPQKEYLEQRNLSFSFQEQRQNHIYNRQKTKYGVRMYLVYGVLFIFLYFFFQN